MYPVLRLISVLWRARRAPRLALLQAHVGRVTCLPWDLDVFAELNNGRTLTLFDLGRLPLVWRLGLFPVLRARGWRLTVAGVSVRFRRRVRAFERLTLVNRVLAWDDRFLYLEHAMWRQGECTSHLLARIAFTTGRGFVAPAAVLAAAGLEAGASPPLPGWVAAWVAAEALRPWPPTAAPAPG